MKRESYILIVLMIILITFNLPAQVNSSLKINSKIVDAEWLSDHLNDPELVILHVSPLKSEYDREHIPGARFLYTGRVTVSNPFEQTVFVPDKDLKKTFESLGISGGSEIVLTFMNGSLGPVCRVYIALDHLGLGDQTYILDGGVEEWKSAGKSVVKDIPVVKKGKLTLAPNGNVVYSTEWIIKNFKSPNVTLIDTRSAPFYVGTSGGPRYGHIPGAVNIPIAKLYDENFRFLPEDKLKEVFQNAGVKPENELVTYCFVGNAASIVYFVAHSLGYNVHLYDGSMDEWGNRFDLPLEKPEVAKEVIPGNVIPFESEQWNKANARIVDFKGRKSLMGIASLKDVEFTNGVIEFDLIVNGERSFPGIMFRMRGEEEYERIYLRPHLPRIYQNVVQYEGTFRGLDSWQLYYGPGKTASAAFPMNEWFHVKVDVKETQARLFINDMSRPVLLITDLVHGIGKGTIGLWGPVDGSAYFSNFSYRIDNSLQFPPLPMNDNPVGIISDWEISRPDMFLNQDIEEYPSPKQQQNMSWQKVKGLPSGLVDISRYYGRLGQLPDIIWAKTELVAVKEETRKLAFGYSDVITVFLNGKLIFAGNSEYTSHDANFQGIIGFNDYLFLPLKKGKNELMISVSESFGGWGFMFIDANAVYEKPGVNKVWEIKNKLRIPESAVYDKKRDAIYVSNYTAENNGFISKVKPNGEIEKLDWITGIIQPTGICINNDKLYIVGRFNLLEYDLEKNQVSARYPMPQPAFPNDVCSDESGNIYVTDSQKGTIYKFVNGVMSEWFVAPSLGGINGILARNGKIYTGTSRDGSIKVIDQYTKEIKTIFSFGTQTVMDGLAMDENGNILFSDNAGRMFKLSADGKNELILNTKTPKINLADFDYIPGRKMLVIPTFYDNRLMMYQIR